MNKCSMAKRIESLGKKNERLFTLYDIHDNYSDFGKPSCWRNPQFWQDYEDYYNKAYPSMGIEIVMKGDDSVDVMSNGKFLMNYSWKGGRHRATAEDGSGYKHTGFGFRDDLSMIYRDVMGKEMGSYQPVYVDEAKRIESFGNKRCEKSYKTAECRKKQESAPVGASEFYSKFIEPRAREILESYEMNDTQGGDGWDAHDVKEIPNTYSDGSARDGFNAGLRKDFVGNLGFFYSSGYLDGQLSNEIEQALDAADRAYSSDNGSIPKEGSNEYDEYLEYADNFLCDMYLWGVATIEFRERSVHGVDYTLSASIGREYDGGGTIGDYLLVEMNLTDSQLTQENADKFIKAVEDAFATYSFSDGDMNIKI